MGREITRSDLTGEFSGVAMDRATYQARPLSSIPGDGESLSYIGSGDSSNQDKNSEEEMEIMDYISEEEVQRVCNELGIEDWTQLKTAKVKFDEAKIIREHIGGEALEISVEEFQQGLEIELEHGIQFDDANVTNNHPLLTGKIVLAHLKEMLDYYARLEVAELEGDVLKALIAGNKDKMADKYLKLLHAKLDLSKKEAPQAND